MRINKSLLLYGLLVAAGLFLSEEAYATAINASSCAQSAVQAAINSAVDGDTVVVPAGSSTWSGRASIGHVITIQGSGPTLTLISSGGFTIPNASRITGFGFSNSSNILATGQGWRIDHCSFSNVPWAEAVSAYGESLNTYPTGLVDHCTFTNMRVLVLGTAYQLTETNGTTQHYLWAQPLNMGTADAVYVEDCTFTSSVSNANCIDADYGGKFVFRHNTVTGFYIEFHSVFTQNRAGRLWEIYNNTMVQNSTNQYAPFRIRGGTGVVFNNVVTGTWGYTSIGLDIVRGDENNDTLGSPPGFAYGVTLSNLTFSAAAKSITRSSGSFPLATAIPSAVCGLLAGDVIQVEGSVSNNGQYTIAAVTASTITTVENLVDESPGATVHIHMPWDGIDGYPARDQIGRGQDAGQCTGNLFAKGNTYYSQASVPAYEWNNTYNGSLMHFAVILGTLSASSIQANRDYYNATQNPSYTPYTYPHPLQGSGGGQPPQQPTGLRIQ